jgi:hypothetical protein
MRYTIRAMPKGSLGFIHFLAVFGHLKAKVKNSEINQTRALDVKMGLFFNFAYIE